MLPKLATLLLLITATSIFFSTDAIFNIQPDEVDQSATYYLENDSDSGCLCRQSITWTICFGREHCHHFPRKLQIKTENLRLKTSKIYELRPNDLANFTFLTEFELDGNFNLTRIWPGSFRFMTKLTRLSISSNPNLTSLEVGVFDGLVNLKKLVLVKNGFRIVSEMAPPVNVKALPLLNKLELSQNHFQEIYENDFEQMNGLPIKELNLVLCQIEMIDKGSLRFFPRLEILRLGENILRSTTNLAELVTAMYEQQIPLRYLNLYSSGFRKLPPKRVLDAIAGTNITSLNLARNQFQTLTVHSFPVMPTLQSLDLSECLILNITNDAFSSLIGLKVLRLTGNKMPSIPDGALLSKLTYLDLRANSDGKLAYFSLFGQRFLKMRQLEELNLSYNRIDAIYNTSFTGLQSVKRLGLKNGTIFFIAPRSFATMPDLAFLDLENNFFVKDKALFPGIFQGLDRLEVLLLGGCGISYLYHETDPFLGLKNLKHLGLERNKLFTIHAEDFQSLIGLQSLDLSQNDLQVWSTRVFEANERMRRLILSDNKLSYFTKQMVDDFQLLKLLEIQENPFSCDCPAYINFNYAQNPSRVLNLLRNQSLYCAISTNITLIKFLENPSENCNFLLNLLYPLGAFLVFLTITALILFYYRWHLRYWIFLTKLYLSRSGRLRTNSARQKYRRQFQNFSYDAFVSYSNEDRNFVIRLVTMLENYPPYIKLCVYERDFQVGTMISENILESVSQSRRTVLIISNSYIKSQWCRWESQIAENHHLFFQNENGLYVDDSLILIKLGAINRINLTPTLKFLLKTKIYLQWDCEENRQKVFWQRLRDVLAPPVEILENTHL